MTLEEAKAYLEAANKDRTMGIGWDAIVALQQGGKSGACKAFRNPRKAKIAGRPCVKCGKPSGSVGLLPICKKCNK